MEDKTERRISTHDLEVRAGASENDPPVITGYAAVFNELSVDLGGFRERIAPGAFSKSLGNDVRALFNHNPDLVLGRTRSRTLTLTEDNRGLKVEITPPNTATARGIVESIRRGDVSQMSFAFKTRADQWDNVDGEMQRTLLDVSLRDVSPVVYPAYPQTEAALRSLAEFRGEGDEAAGDDGLLPYERGADGDSEERAASLNTAGRAYARSLISAGRITDKAWAAPTGAETDAMLGANGDNWAELARHYLGVDTSQAAKTKGRYKYPFAKGGALYLAALRNVASRAGAQGDNAVRDAASALLTAANKKVGRSDDDEGIAERMRMRAQLASV